MAQVPATKKATISADIFGSVLTLTFRDGREFVVDVSKLTPEMQRQAMLHGMKQKLVDAAAIARNLDTGLPASLNDKHDAVKEVFDRVVRSATPTWNKERSTGEAKLGANSVFVRALMQMTGKDKTYIDAFLEAKTKEERAALKKNARVLQIMAELHAANASNDSNTDEMLAELGAMDTLETDAPAEAPQEVVEEQPAVTKPKRASKKAAATAE